MSFEHLEDAVPEGREEEFLTFFDNLQEPTKTGFGLTMDIGAYLNNAGLNADYAISGGYAILAQLMRVDGTGIATAWKGFRNPTVEGNKKVLGALRAGYRTTGGPNGTPNASVYDMNFLLNGNGQHVTFGYHNGRMNPQNVETHQHFGVPVQVRTPESLLDSRLSVSSDTMGNIGDTLTLVHIMEKLGYSPREVAYHASNNGTAMTLHSRLKQGLSKFENDRFGVFPSDKFSSELVKRLHKMRPIR